MTDRRLLLSLAALLTLAIPLAAWAEDPCRSQLVAVAALSGDDGSGVGGTGLGGDDGSGVGGTGLGGDDGSGVGGTGLEGGSGVGGTGISIYGTLTAFGSICVNGLRIAYDADALVQVDGRSADTSALAVGEVVWVEAELGGDEAQRGETLRARRIEVLHALVGRIDAAEPGAAHFELLGRRVDILPETRLAGEPGELLRTGRSVAVSGLWRDGDRVVATRIEPAPLDASHVGPHLMDLLSRTDRVEALSVEGYLSARDDAFLRVDGLDVLWSGPSRSDLAPGSRVRATGRLTAENILRIERPARPEPPERPERPPRIERPEKIERPEVFDRPEVSPRLDTIR